MKKIYYAGLLSLSLLTNSLWGADMSSSPTTSSWTAEECVQGEILVKEAANGDLSRLAAIHALHPCLINFKDGEGCTALMVAALNGHAEIVDTLLAAGAQVNAQSNKGWTALLLAAVHKENIAIVNTLIAAGATIDAHDNEGCTALMIAARWGSTEIVTRLIAAGAEVNAQNNEGNTALIKATYESHAKVVQLLLDARADIMLKNEDDNTALALAQNRFEIAESDEQKTIVALLQNHVPIEPEEETLMVKPALIELT